MFILRTAKTEFGRQSLLFRGPILWNSLNNETRDMDNVNKFMLALKKCDLYQKSFMKGTSVNLKKEFTR